MRNQPDLICFSRYPTWVRGMVYMGAHICAIAEEQVVETSRPRRQQMRDAMDLWGHGEIASAYSLRPATGAPEQALALYHTDPGLSVAGYVFDADDGLLQVSATIRLREDGHLEATSQTVVYEGHRTATRIVHKQIVGLRDSVARHYGQIIKNARSQVSDAGPRLKFHFALDRAVEIDPRALAALFEQAVQTKRLTQLQADVQSAPLAF